MWQNLQETVDLVTFTEEILNGKLHFLCSGVTFFPQNVKKIRRSPLSTGSPHFLQSTF